MTVYQRTVPSAVLGEYLADVERFWTAAYLANKGEPVPREVLQASLDNGLASAIEEWYGEDAVWDYWRGLLHRAQRVRAIGRHYQSSPHQPKPNPVKAPKRRGRKPRRQSLDTRVKDRRLREEMIKAVNDNGRVNRGLRRLGQDADMSEASVRRALDAWQASGQLRRDDRGKGKTQSIKLNLGHPAWSEYLPSHPRSA
jgi:hypothetical protein